MSAGDVENQKAAPSERLMPSSGPRGRKKLIEVALPLEAINAESAKRKQKAPKGYPTTLHKYWAQRPVAACRGILFAQLVDDPSSWPDLFVGEEAQATERRRLHKLMERLISWDASNDEAILAEAKYEIAASLARAAGASPPSNAPEAVRAFLASNGPVVCDPFAGSGTIPLEAQRLGLRVIGSDLNPVAVLISKALVEIPPRFANRPPINPERRGSLPLGGWRGAEGLADDVRYFGQRLRTEAFARIGGNYPRVALSSGSEATVVAWLWARTVRSPDPAAMGAMVPLVSSFVLSNKGATRAWVEPVLDPSAPDGWRFEVESGRLQATDEARLRKGTKISRGNFACLLTGAPISEEWNRAEGKAGRLGKRLMAIVADSPEGRVYLSPDQVSAVAADASRPPWRPEGELFERALGFRVPGYGLTQWSDLFTDRQLLALATCSDLVSEIRGEVFDAARDAGLPITGNRLEAGGTGAEAYADAVATYLAIVVDRMAFYGSTLCGWLAKDNAMGKSMPQQTLSMTWDFAEGNPFGKSSTDINTCCKAVSDCLSQLGNTVQGEINGGDARRITLPNGCVISTDPPYYDNIGYADLSDFFYVWLRKSLTQVWPGLFRRMLTPKAEELVATAGRHGGRDLAEKYFMDGMSTALANMASAVTDEVPLTIYYAFKQSETSSEGITSTGWASFLQAVVHAGFVIGGTWPVRTENASRLRGQDANALASSIVLVCRKRASNAGVITGTEFIRELKQELPSALKAIRQAGVGPVDMQQSIIGPGMAVFSRHSKILADDDSSMTVKSALSVINRVWDEIENELDASFDPATQVALAWYGSYGFESRPSGDLITLTTAKNTVDRALFSSGVFKDLKGKAALTPREELPSSWTPAGDKTLTVWECVQHTARVLGAADGGALAAARLVSQMGAKSEEARALAYRLFEVATRQGWSAEALVYNQLAEEWPGLEELASAAASPRAGSMQGTLNLEPAP